MPKFAIIECSGVTQSRNPAHREFQHHSNLTGRIWDNTSAVIEATGPEDAAARLLHFRAEELEARPWGEAAFEVFHRSCRDDSGVPHTKQIDVCVMVVPLS